MNAHIIADSACDLPQGFDENLTVVPLTVAFGSTVYRDGVDLDQHRFYELLVESDDLPTTSQIPPFGFTQAIEQVHGRGIDDIVVITVSSKLSGTYQSASIAAHEAEGTPGLSVTVVDSLNVTLGENVLVRYALRLAAQGLSGAEIARELTVARGRVEVIALLDTLEYLRRGGRVPAASAAIGELLSIKPVVGVEDGEVKVLGKARGSKNGRNLLNRRVEELGGIDFTLPVCLGYSGLSDKLLQKYIDDSGRLWEGHCTREELPICLVGATIGTHVGPGAIAVAFFHNA